MTAALIPGIVAEFDEPDALVRAVRELRRRGYRNIDAFAPYRVRGLDAAIGTARGPTRWAALATGLAKFAARVVRRFEPARIERFFVGIDAGGPSFDGPRLAAELIALGAARVTFPRAGTCVQTESFAPHGHRVSQIP